MALKPKDTIAAIIDIGSGEMRLRIAERTKGKIKFIESMQYPLNLAKDTFNQGTISFEKANKVCEILQGFISVCRDYGISTIKAIATTAVREAANREYILDQIKINTGLDIKVIDDNAEKLYIFKMMTHLVESRLKKSALMTYIGSGSVGVGIWEDGAMPVIKNIKAGSLRISEMFERVAEYSSEFYMVYEEYISDYIESIAAHTSGKLENFIAAGAEMPLIARMCDAEYSENFYTIDSQIFMNLYDEIKFKTAGRISNEYNISEEKAETLLAEMCIYKNLLFLTKAETIIVPAVFLAEAIAFEILFPNEFSDINKEFHKYTLLSARRIAEKYHVYEEHYKAVEKYCIEIFDKMKKVYGLSRRDSLLLQTAVILHDTGKYINLQNHYLHSYNIIQGSEIAGLSEEERDIVANICFYHSKIVPAVSDNNYRELKPSKKVLISKLSAILRIADALDSSKKQKIKDITVKVEENNLFINASATENCELEQWVFNEKSLFFQDVFGIKTALRIRKVI